jgi:dihydroflavonol-4-reductase
MSSNLKVDTSMPVLVTGATGYVAGVLIKELLELGVTVHAAVRDPSKTSRLQYLVDMADKSKGSIKFFKGDLLDEGSYAEGMKGCSVVFHTASPFTISVKDPQKDLVDPAVKGTRNVLNSATQTPSVRRVVVTSSVVAIYTDSTDVDKAPNKVFTEDVWNMTASLDYQPYSYSKTLAELAAWQIAGSQRQWTLATINPSFVLGPGVSYHESSESFSTMKFFGDGTFAFGCPMIAMGIVDVRDVAHAHVVAAYNEEAAVGRHILSGTNTNFVEIAAALRKKYPQYSIPTRVVPKFLMWLIAPYMGLSRRYVSNNVHVPINLDNSKAKEALGIQFRSLDVTVQEMFQQLIDEGVVQKKK